MVLNTIVFSKDRAMQLDLFLQSIVLNFQVDDYKLTILYKTSTDDFKRGYDLLISKYPQFSFIEEKSFRDDLISILDYSDYTVFFTDDDIIYKSLNINKQELNNIFVFSNATCFSLRLGLNTTNCYTMQKLNKLNKYNTHSYYHDIDLIEPIISWMVCDGTNDYAYPMSVDGHIFKTDYIKELCNFLNYYNPNTFEAMLTNATKYDMIMASYKESKLVNSPINRVQETFQNLSGIKYGYTPEDLNEMYLDGVTFNFEKMNFSEVNGCHQEIQPVFKLNEK